MNKNRIVVVSILLLGIILSMFVLYTPVPNTELESEFNTKFAIEYIAEFAEKEHSVFDEENHEEVRLYLKDKLEEFLGAENVYEYDYDRSLFEDEIEYDIKNLLGVIPGESDTAIMIVAHYDSRGHIGRTGELGNSFGAADDGYGIATMLEIARIYGDKDLENTIYILMTDGEETGLYGAAMAADEDFMDNVGFVINIEARGVDGPAYMFETSTDNAAVIDFYKNAELPVSYSLATAVYTVMPNSTDFTEFLAVDKNGVNFAVLSGLYYYHTPHDNFTNVNPSSIEHYGRQIIPMVDEFSMNEEYSDVDYFESDSNQIFFTLFPNVFIAYGEGFGTILHTVLFVLSLGLLGLLFYKKQTDIKKLGVAFGIVIGSFVFTILLGYIISRVVAFISKVPFNITYVRTTIGDIPTLITLGFITVLFGYLYYKKTTDEGIRDSIIIIGAIINTFLALITGIVLSGASFLFLIPGLSAVLFLGMNQHMKGKLISKILLGILMVLNILVVIPILYSLYLALTVGGLLALGLILVYYLLFLIPVFTTQFE